MIHKVLVYLSKIMRSSLDDFLYFELRSYDFHFFTSENSNRPLM